MLDRTRESLGDAPLSDGVRLSELIDHEKREVAQRVMADPEIYELELKNIFARSWILLGHESEIPNTGDFVTRQIGEDPVILSRQKDGSISCVLNACSHRGATVCRTEQGNASVHRCIYHGWVFNLDGSFRGAPFHQDMFPDGCDNSKLGLRRARVEVFCGIIFANWDEDAEDLQSYLGDFSWYLNSIFGRAKDGYEVLGPPQRFVVDANWKAAAEQFAGDGYHAGQLHRSLADLVDMDPNNPRQWSLCDPKVSTDKGHGIICFTLKERLRRVAKDGGVDDMTPIERFQVIPPPGMMPDQVEGMTELFNPDELRLLSENPPSIGGMFPNVGIWSNLAMLPDGGASAFLSLRTFVPRGPDKFEFVMWVFAAKNATEEFRNKLRLTASFGQGAAGFVESDDAEVWPGISRAARGYIGRQNKLRYWAESGVDKPDDWPAGGNVHTGFSRDDNQWSWWSHYFKTLTAAD